MLTRHWETIAKVALTIASVVCLVWHCRWSGNGREEWANGTGHQESSRWGTELKPAVGPRPKVGACEIREPFRIEVTGSDRRWHVRYPDVIGPFVFERRGLRMHEIHVPQNTHVVLVFKSSDYIYTFALPECGLKEIAVPDLEFPVQLCPIDAGRYEFHGDELCGDPKTDLDGALIVESHDRFLEWYEEMNAGVADRRMVHPF